LIALDSLGALIKVIVTGCELNSLTKSTNMELEFHKQSRPDLEVIGEGMSIKKNFG